VATRSPLPIGTTAQSTVSSSLIVRLIWRQATVLRVADRSFGDAHPPSSSPFPALHRRRHAPPGGGAESASPEWSEPSGALDLGPHPGRN
jgi:hypothetical protein